MGYESWPQYEVSDADIAQVNTLVTELEKAGCDPGLGLFHDGAWELLEGLPAGLRCLLEDFRREESAGACVVRGFPVDDVAVGPTPGSWSVAAASTSTRREELLLGLLARCLGEVFGWSGRQGGRMVQDVLPGRAHGGAVQREEWHTEDASHPYRCDYLALLGIRNPAAVPTTLASVRDVRLPAPLMRVLFEPRFQIASGAGPVAVLSGARDAPYLRIDPGVMGGAPGDRAARHALGALMAELERNRRDVVVDAGTLLVVDNYVAVHGRPAYPAGPGGSGRWLKKAHVTRDLRKSRAVRASAAGRVLLSG
ncbi:hypothetical protein [Streptomyces purpureus]|uniref:hypothetical protein n=1 Tax=Streptomyces purpureus TaxID=1951 RepID=UPI000372FFC9|nr:hypothetical protein [Streptomyces purpureus]